MSNYVIYTGYNGMIAMDFVMRFERFPDCKYWIQTPRRGSGFRGKSRTQVSIGKKHGLLKIVIHPQRTFKFSFCVGTTEIFQSDNLDGIKDFIKNYDK